MQMDRFGRVAFNKDRQLSIASLQKSNSSAAISENSEQETPYDEPKRSDSQGIQFFAHQVNK